MKTIELVIHDWWNLRKEERAQAIEDVRELAARTIVANHRRGRALNIVASFLHFGEAEVAPQYAGAAEWWVCGELRKNERGEYVLREVSTKSSRHLTTIGDAIRWCTLSGPWPTQVVAQDELPNVRRHHGLKNP